MYCFLYIFFYLIYYSHKILNLKSNCDEYYSKKIRFWENVENKKTQVSNKNN